MVMQLLPLKFPKKNSPKTLILLLQAFHSENIFPSHFLCLSRERDKQVHDYPLLTIFAVKISATTFRIFLTKTTLPTPSPP